MAAAPSSAALIGGVTVLERAVSYTLGSLSLVREETLTRPTPCDEWDLRALLEHMDDALAALCEAADAGRIEVESSSPPSDVADELVTRLKNRASQLIAAWVSHSEPSSVDIADKQLTSSIVAGCGAIGIAVHGWDVARACGQNRPIPASLADELLDLAVVVVTDADRPAQFGWPVDVSPLAEPSDRLVAFLGRQP